MTVGLEFFRSIALIFKLGSAKRMRCAHFFKQQDSWTLFSQVAPVLSASFILIYWRKAQKSLIQFSSVYKNSIFIQQGALNYPLLENAHLIQIW